MTAHVLVIDDDAATRDVIQTSLELEGYSVDTAPHGQEALAHIAARRPCVVLLDLRMPIMDGWEFEARLHDWGLDIPVIIMSGAIDTYHQARRLHAAAALAKPFDIGRLLDAVEHLAFT